MIQKITKPLLASLLFAMLLLVSYSCANDDYLSEHDVRRMIEEALRQNNEQLEFTQWKIVNIAIKKGDWQWDDDVKHYFVVCDLPELTEFIYENGANIGYLFLGEQNYSEVQKLLPYVHTYYETNDNGEVTYTYTETISYDIQYKVEGVVKPSVAFFIQPSDVYRDDQFVFDYNFRIVLIW
jgi:hypothetical protein